MFKPKPVRVEFGAITTAEREPSSSQNQDVFKIIYPGGNLIIRENLCASKSDFEEIINLVEKGMQPALKRQRTLVNGTGEKITITSDVADCNNPIWWADLYHMLRNQSKEDASVLAGMFQLEDDQKPLILSTVSDGQNESVNTELWQRLLQIGYLEVSMDQEIPDELNGKVVYYSLTDLGKANLLIFKLATKVRCEELTDDTTPIAVFAEKFLSLCDFHNSLSIQHLEALRYLLAEKEDVLASPGKNQEMVFQMYEIAGALSASNDDPARWSKTTMGQLVAPFILDMYITRKRNHKMLH